MLDAIPLSLGTNVKNNYKEKKIAEEGDLMSVIIKRGTFFPVSFSKTYSTIINEQDKMDIDIYEGDNNFVKYNHLLKKAQISGLTPRPKGQTKVVVTFDISIDGILSVKAEEESKDNNGQKIFLTIKNDEISLDDEAIQELKLKNIELMDKMNQKDLSGEKDYTNLKGVLKKYNDAYQKCKDNKNNNKNNKNSDEDDDGAIYKINFNNALETFIDSFGKAFDNETLFEKVYLYIKQLFSSYCETLTLNLDEDDRKNISSKIKEYISLFIDKSSDYLNNLIELLSDVIKIKKKLKASKKKKF
jgi:molecular chaperone DnaK (HSP70)